MNMDHVATHIYNEASGPLSVVSAYMRFHPDRVGIL